jgi:hypothetical protein
MMDLTRETSNKVTVLQLYRDTHFFLICHWGSLGFMSFLYSRFPLLHAEFIVTPSTLILWTMDLRRRYNVTVSACIRVPVAVKLSSRS